MAKIPIMLPKFNVPQQSRTVSELPRRGKMQLSLMMTALQKSFGCWLLAAVMVGCGGKSDPPPAAQTDSPSEDQSTAATEQATAGTSASSGSPGQNEVWTDENGNRFLGQVPFDVFYDQPYTVASNTTPLTGAAAEPVASLPGVTTPTATSSTAPMTAEPTETAGGSTTAAASGDVAWTELIPIEVLDAEIKSVRNFLNATLQSVASYNSSMLMIEPKAATVAALAAISEQHPGDISWKEDAAYIRNLAKKMTESPLQRGKKDQARLLTLFENMRDTFNRSRPAGLEEPPADDSFVDVAEMRLLMQRMEEAEKKMKTEAGSESLFSEKPDMIRHEAALLKTFTHLISQEEYGYGDDEEFRKYAGGVMEGVDSIRTAVDANDFNAYQLALSTISTNCQQCHRVFKNN